MVVVCVAFVDATNVNDFVLIVEVALTWSVVVEMVKMVEVVIVVTIVVVDVDVIVVAVVVVVAVVRQVSSLRLRQKRFSSSIESVSHSQLGRLISSSSIIISTPLRLSC